MTIEIELTSRWTDRKGRERVAPAKVRFDTEAARDSWLACAAEREALSRFR